jgi:hypothetical protein
LSKRYLLPSFRSPFEAAWAVKDSAPRGPANLKPAGDFSFGDTGTVQSPDLSGVPSRRDWPTQPLAVLPGVGQAGTHPFLQNLPFERSEYGQQSGHGASGWRGQVQRLGQGDETYAEDAPVPEVSPAGR